MIVIHIAVLFWCRVNDSTAIRRAKQFTWAVQWHSQPLLYSLHFVNFANFDKNTDKRDARVRQTQRAKVVQHSKLHDIFHFRCERKIDQLRVKDSKFIDWLWGVRLKGSSVEWRPNSKIECKLRIEVQKREKDREKMERSNVQQRMLTQMVNANHC